MEGKTQNSEVIKGTQEEGGREGGRELGGGFRGFKPPLQIVSQCMDDVYRAFVAHLRRLNLCSLCVWHGQLYKLELDLY